jgi:RNA polymerase sigma factor for flagellar operon FliA
MADKVRELLIVRYMPLVHRVVRKCFGSAPRWVDRDDLVSAGTVGLIRAVDGFDPGRGVAFSTYAWPRIRGAILDSLAPEWTPLDAGQIPAAGDKPDARAQLRDTIHSLAGRIGRGGERFARRRRLILSLLADGLSPIEASAAVGNAPSAVAQWLMQLRHQSSSPLTDRQRRGLDDASTRPD